MTKYIHSTSVHTCSNHNPHVQACTPLQSITQYGAVLKHSIKWEQGEDQQDPALTLKKLGNYYAGTKNIIHERVLFNRMKREENDSIAKWEMMCQEQGTKCEYCNTCTPEII